MALRSLVCSAALWGALWTLGAAAAWAQDVAPDAPAGPPKSAEAVRAALLGYEIAGEVVGTGQPWTECIDPHGRTLWRLGDFATEGRMQIRDDGQACFRYRYTQFRREACWTMREDAEGRLRFDLANGESLPLVVLVRRPVSSCGGDAPIA